MNAGMTEGDGGFVTLRSATPEDAGQLLEIYRPYVTDTTITFEYQVPTVEEFAGRIQETLRKYPYLVAEWQGDDGEAAIVGYAYARPFKSRAAYGWAVETSVYVAMDQRGRGVGGALYRCLEQLLKRQNFTNINACITWPNPESEEFHRHMGYRNAGHFTQCGYKLGRWCDIIWMEKQINEHQVPPMEILPPEILPPGSMVF